MSLIDYCRTDTQRKTIEAWEESGRNSAIAAVKMNISPSTVRDHVSYAKAAAAAAGYTDNWDARRHVPEGEVVVGRSIYTTTDDNEKVWLKTRRTFQEAQKAEAFNAFVDQLNQGVIPVKRTPKGKKVRKDDLMPCCIIGDAHIGALAYKKDTGDRDFSVEKATKEVNEAICTLVDQMPEAKNGLLVSLGDLAHSDRADRS